MLSKKLTAISIIIAFTFVSCSAPRTIYNSGRVTSRNHVKVGVDYTTNISTGVFSSTYDGLKGIAEDLINEDSITLNENVTNINKAALAYSLDPFAVGGVDFYLRYGIYKRLDIGYKNSSGVSVFDVQYQLFGDDSVKNGFFGSIAVQYSSQGKDLLGFFGFGQLEKVLGFEFSRKDLMIPLIFSIPFGEQEKVGHLGFGLAYCHTFLKYGLNPEKIYDYSNGTIPVLVPSFSEKKDYSAYGMFINMKLGYKYLYVLPAISMFWQDYGRYQLVDGTSMHLKGMTFLPTIGLHAAIPPLWSKKWRAKNIKKKND